MREIRTSGATRGAGELSLLPPTLPLIVPSRAEVERGHLAGVSYQQNSTGNNGDVPGLAFDPRNASKLTVRVRCGLDEDKLTALGDNAK